MSEQTICLELPTRLSVKYLELSERGAVSPDNDDYS
jgi:hypothetical protein